MGDTQLWRAEREVLEAIRDTVAKALGTKVGEPKEERDMKGNVKAYRLHLHGHHLAPFLEHAAEHVKAVPAEVRLEVRRVVVEAGDAKAEVEFRLLKRKEVKFLLAQDVTQTLALYKSLKALGVPAEITPRGIKIDGKAMWALAATAVEKAIERGALGGLPAEVMPGVELLNVYSAGGMEMYAFQLSEEDTRYYLAVKTKEVWRVAGGKYDGKQVLITGEAARAVADAINAVYREIGVKRRIVVRQKKNNVSYILLTNVDLKLLGIG